FGLTGIAIAYAVGSILQNVTIMILVRRELYLQWWDGRYLEWLPQCGAALTVASIALSLATPLNATELATCLIAMYAAAVGVTLLRGLNEDDRQLLRYVRQVVGLATLP